MSPPDSALLDLVGLDAYWGDGHVLQGITMRVGQREGVAVLGRNGAGKSTLMKAIMGAGPRVAGQRLFESAPLDDMPTHHRARRGLSFVPEDRRVFNHLTVAGNLRLARHAARPGVKPFAPADMAALFPMLAGLMDRPGYALSGGQQQMVAVARGLIPRPKLLLLDEPAEGLAPIIVEQLAAEVARIREQEGFSLLLAEQNLGFARLCTERVVVLETGRVVFTGDWPAFDADSNLQAIIAI
jgi:branched-chain amino acid transport system ATP-binding protein